MQNLYEVLQDPTKEILRLHSIKYFDEIVEKHPSDYINIIRYINDCFNYHSVLLLEEKDWRSFLIERFYTNDLPEEILPGLVDYETGYFVLAISMFLEDQKQPVFTTLVAKQNLRVNMLATMQTPSATTNDKKNANEMVSSLDSEIAMIYEKFRQGQKVFGNFKGYDQFKTARNKHLINTAQFID